MSHPDHKKNIPRLKRIQGQIDGIERMILERRYCPDIIQQLRAIESAVKAVEVEILKGHLASCIKDSAQTDSHQKFEKKLTEVLNLIRR